MTQSAGTGSADVALATNLPTVVPDYGWQSGEAEASHRYLVPVVLRAIADADAQLDESGKALRVFDAGCGNGALLNRLFNLGHDVAGCELSASGVSQARKLCNVAVRIEQASLYDDLAAEFGSQWDIVIATEVIEHLYAPRTFMERARQLLVPGGFLILSTPYHGYAKNLALSLTGAMDRHFTALWDGGHIKFWSYHTLRHLLEEFGFNQHRFHGAGRLPWLWKSMVVASRKQM